MNYNYFNYCIAKGIHPPSSSPPISCISCLFTFRVISTTELAVQLLTPVIPNPFLYGTVCQTTWMQDSYGAVMGESILSKVRKFLDDSSKRRRCESRTYDATLLYHYFPIPFSYSTPHPSPQHSLLP